MTMYDMPTSDSLTHRVKYPRARPHERANGRVVAFHSPMIRASESPWIGDQPVTWHDSRPMGEYPILEGYSANFQQLSMRPFDLRSKGHQQPVSWSRLPRPSPRSHGRTLGDLTRCVRLSDVGMSYIVIT